jgi:hypothetical protein
MLVENLETRLGISQRWTASSPEYMQYNEENVKTEYQKALDELEQLVVM